MNTDFIPFKTDAIIYSLNSKFDEVEIIDKTRFRNQDVYIVNYKGTLCTAIFNYFVNEFYVDDVFGKVQKQNDTWVMIPA